MTLKTCQCFKCLVLSVYSDLFAIFIYLFSVRRKKDDQQNSQQGQSSLICDQSAAPGGHHGIYSKNGTKKK